MTRQSYDVLMELRQRRREEGLARLKSRLGRLETKRGAIQCDLDKLRRKAVRKTDRAEALKKLAADGWADGEPSLGRDTLEGIDTLVRREKSYLARIRSRVRELESQGAEVEAAVHAAKEDKARRLADVDRREREATETLRAEREAQQAWAQRAAAPGGSSVAIAQGPGTFIGEGAAAATTMAATEPSVLATEAEPDTPASASQVEGNPGAGEGLGVVDRRQGPSLLAKEGTFRTCSGRSPPHPEQERGGWVPGAGGGWQAWHRGRV
ncbi:unnamed protein product [Discosporangium mesarthrocarpum]